MTKNVKFDITLYSYKRYKQTQKEYEDLQLEKKEEVPQGILEEIEEQILPTYLIKEKSKDI